MIIVIFAYKLFRGGNDGKLLKISRREKEREQKEGRVKRRNGEEEGRRRTAMGRRRRRRREELNRVDRSSKFRNAIERETGRGGGRRTRGATRIDPADTLD